MTTGEQLLERAIEHIDREMPPDEFHTDGIKARVELAIVTTLDWEDMEERVKRVLVNQGVFTPTEAKGVSLAY